MGTILLIEDQPNQRLLLTQELEDEGYQVLPAANAAEAMRLYQQHHPKLIITDILLPGMNGIELMEKMLGHNPGLPIIVHSAYSSPQHDFITWFARAYVLKSGDLSNLKAEVRRAIEHSTPPALHR